MTNKFRDIDTRLNNTYLSGVMLAINAINDANLVVDSPECILKKAEHICVNHDIFSTLTERVYCTNTEIETAYNDRTSDVIRVLEEADQIKKIKKIFLTSMPVNTITGMDYSNIISNLKKESLNSKIISVNAKSLDYDWLDGYGDVLMSLSEHLELKNKKKLDNSVALVGYLWERNEGDHVGNMHELNRVFDMLSIKLISVWCGGGSIKELEKIEKAKLIVTFSNYEKLANGIAAKTGADVLVLDMPFGPKKTIDFFKSIAKFFNKSGECKKIIKSEMRETLPIIKQVVDLAITDNTFSYYGEPYFAVALVDVIKYFGGEIKNAVLFSRERKNVVRKMEKLEFTNIQFQPQTTKVQIFLSDIHIGNSIGHNYTGKENYITIGYPSVNQHFFCLNPIWGFKGFIVFLNMIYNSMRSIKEV